MAVCRVDEETTLRTGAQKDFAGDERAAAREKAIAGAPGGSTLLLDEKRIRLKPATQVTTSSLGAQQHTAVRRYIKQMFFLSITNLQN